MDKFASLALLILPALLGGLPVPLPDALAAGDASARTSLGPPPSLACSRDAECVVIQGVCPGEWQPVNVRWKARRLEALRQQASVATCSYPQKAPDPGHAACRKGACVLVLAPASH